MQKYKALRGTTDLLPDYAKKWHRLESISRSLFESFCYREIRTPIIEPTSLFARGLGDTSDVVQKQMFTFKDRGDRSISLRPEATASVIRAYLENHLDKKLGFAKLFYMGPMFRSERPQAARSRQFHQIGVEAIGSYSPLLDVEVIALLATLLKEAGLDGFKIRINSLGCKKDKHDYSQLLKKELKLKTNQLCSDCRERFRRNVFRVLDCKNETCQAVVRGLPKIINNLCMNCEKDFNAVQDGLKLVGVSFSQAPYLVRGLDYYTKTAFEVNHSKLGAQDAVAAGGRYDNLVGDFGGSDTGAVGFALGVERLMSALKDAAEDEVGGAASIYLVTLGDQAYKKAIELLQQLRVNGISSEIDYQQKSLKAQMRTASKLGFRYVAILGDDELKKGEVGLKDMETGKQKSVKLKGIIKHIKAIF